MADGGRNAYRGLRYQYLRTLEALMAAMEEPALGISAVHIEGMPGRDGADRDSVDYELSDASGRVLQAVQVKKRAMKKTMGASDAFRALKRLVEDQEADRYTLQVGARPGESVEGLAAVLESAQDPIPLRTSIDAVLASGDQRGVLAGMPDEHLARMTRARIEFDARDDAEISESLRLRLRRYRERTRAGLGDESAGLLIDHLLEEISRRGERETGAATVEVSDFRSWVCVEGVILQQVLGRRDWGLVIGSLPPVPDVRRGEILDRIRQMLPPGRRDGHKVRAAGNVGHREDRPRCRLRPGPGGRLPRDLLGRRGKRADAGSFFSPISTATSTALSCRGLRTSRYCAERCSQTCRRRPGGGSSSSTTALTCVWRTGGCRGLGPVTWS